MKYFRNKNVKKIVQLSYQNKIKCKVRAFSWSSSSWRGINKAIIDWAFRVNRARIENSSFLRWSCLSNLDKRKIVIDGIIAKDGILTKRYLRGLEKIPRENCVSAFPSSDLNNFFEKQREFISRYKKRNFRINPEGVSRLFFRYH